MTEPDEQKESGVESHFKELRLAEHAFFREAFKNIKTKYRRFVLWIFLSSLTFVLLWCLFSCPLLGKIGLCPMSH